MIGDISFEAAADPDTWTRPEYSRNSNAFWRAPFSLIAQRASSFLRFIVERTLDGRTSEIKESIIAIEVMGRSPSFDSRTDPIVRVEAVRLRDRLREYYDRHGRADDVLISVPKGSYVPQFVEREPQTQVFDVLRLSILPPAGADFESFAISPDGRRIAFTAQANGSLMLWVRELDSLDARPLPGTETAAFPFWSPDSRSIGFFTPFKLKVVPASGGPCREIADVVVGRGATWNAQGTIVFCPRPVGPLYCIAAEGGTPAPVTTLETGRSEIAHGFPAVPAGRSPFHLLCDELSAGRVIDPDRVARFVHFDADRRERNERVVCAVVPRPFGMPAVRVA